MLFFCGCDISQNFLIAKDSGKDTADTGIVITDFFTGKGKVSLNRKLFSMFSRTPPAAGMCRSKVIHNRINPCITNKIQVRIFIDNTDQILFRIPAVTENNDMFPALKFRHDFTDHGGSKFQFGFFFLPHTVSKRNGKIRDLILIPHRYAKHDTYKTVSIHIVRTIVCGMVKQF